MSEASSSVGFNHFYRGLARRVRRINNYFGTLRALQPGESFCFSQYPVCLGIFNFGFPDGAITGIVRPEGMNDKAQFFEDVHDVVRLVPAGRVTTYGAIAAYLGLKSAARMVGWAMNAAHVVTGVPAHRVVNRNGLLTGKHHFGSPDEMQRRLEAEGVQVVDDQVQNFHQLLWEPVKELSEP